MSDDFDPGIRETVRWLQANGFNTTDSGDGKTKPEDQRALGDIPHVFMVIEPRERIFDEASRLYMISRDVPDAWVEASFNPQDGVVVLGLFGVDDDALRTRRGGN